MTEPCMWCKFPTSKIVEVTMPARVVKRAPCCADCAAGPLVAIWSKSEPVTDADAISAALARLVGHVEGINRAFYVEGTSRALKAAMAGQRELLDLARAALRGQEIKA